MTGQWEAYLKRIQRGEAQLEPFLHGIEDYVREVIGKVGQIPAAPRRAQWDSSSSGIFSPVTASAAFGSPCRHVVPQQRSALLAAPG